jgi:hypothetical protein
MKNYKYSKYYKRFLGGNIYVFRKN